MDEPPVGPAFRAEVTTTIWGTKNAWSLARHRETDDPTEGVRVVLTIQGDTRSGYHLIQSPEGFFTADTWHPTLDDAFDAAHEMFGVSRGAWLG
jgi:hypothetical protein